MANSAPPYQLTPSRFHTKNRLPQIGQAVQSFYWLREFQMNFANSALVAVASGLNEPSS